MNKFILRWIISSLAIFAAVELVPGIHISGNPWISILVLGLIMVIVNAILRPLVKFVGCLPIILTLGLFTLLINAFLFWLTGQIGQAIVGYGFTTDGFWPAFWGGLVVSIVSIVMGVILRDELKRR